jgi:peptide/nickel transport system permease protein
VSASRLQPGVRVDAAAHTGRVAAARPRRHAVWSALVPLTRSPLSILALAIAMGWAVVAATAPLLAPYPPLAQNIDNTLAPPNPVHWLGTDVVGRDMLSRILFGARISMPVGIVSVALAVVFGTAVGSIAGFKGGLTDEALMRATDIMLAFPTVIMAMVITAALGPGIRDAVIAIMVAWWPFYARLVRSLVLSVREHEYVEAARALGASQTRALTRHVLPNVIAPIVVVATLDVGQAILAFASLSFLGLGPPPQTPEWGLMIATGRNYLSQWWIGTFPGLALLTLVLSFNIIGDGVRDLIDPRLRRT